MRPRPIRTIRPELERFEVKSLPSAGPLPPSAALVTSAGGADLEREVGTSKSTALRPAARAISLAQRQNQSMTVRRDGPDVQPSDSRQAARPQKYTLFRITNPTPFNTRLVPPFQQVLVQSRQPIPGQIY